MMLNIISEYRAKPNYDYHEVESVEARVGNSLITN